MIAGGTIGRTLAYHGADVLNIWRPNDSELEAFAWDAQVGMRSTILDDSKEDRTRFDQLLSKADIFFANKRPGFLKLHGLDAEELCARKPGLTRLRDPGTRCLCPLPPAPGRRRTLEGIGRAARR